VAQVLTTSRTIASTTGFATYTSTPGLASSSDRGGSSGLSDSSKKIIGGVVGGIGGVILLGGIALVAWRMQRRKNMNAKARKAEEDYLDSSREESVEGMGRQDAFANNLEQYHQQRGPAANF